MGAIADAVMGIIGGVADVGFKAYDREQQNKINQRDFDYQKALQQQIFEREDNAVQRRMADLQAAGLNPNLAAGSAAGAGSVVGRSQTNYAGIGNPVGTILDTISARQQISMQKEQAAILNSQKEEAAAKARMADNAALLDNLYTVQMLGLNPKLAINKKGQLESRFSYTDEDLTHGQYTQSPMYQQLKWQIQNEKNNAWMIQKDVDFYNADKIFSYIGAGARAAGNLTGGIGSLYGNYYKYHR